MTEICGDVDVESWIDGGVLCLSHGVDQQVLSRGWRALMAWKMTDDGKRDRRILQPLSLQLLS
jgi:hypothetical protein